MPNIKCNSSKQQPALYLQEQSARSLLEKLGNSPIHRASREEFESKTFGLTYQQRSEK